MVAIRQNRLRVGCLVALLALTGCASSTSRDGRPIVQPSVRDFEARIPALRAAIPAITASAEAAAAQMIVQPQTLLHTPYWEQIAFAEEMINRAGGLAHAYPTGAAGRHLADAQPPDALESLDLSRSSFGCHITMWLPHGSRNDAW